MIICHALTGSSDVEDWYDRLVLEFAISPLTLCLSLQGGDLSSDPITLSIRRATSSFAPTCSGRRMVPLRRRPRIRIAKMEDGGDRNFPRRSSGTMFGV